jgi:putative transposase
VDGLKGLPDAVTAAFPETMVQTCVRHWAWTNGAFNGSLPLIRHSMTVCSWKDRKARSSGRQSPGLFSDPPRTAGLRPVHEAPTADEAARQLEAFEEKWAGKCPSIAPAWRRAGAEVTPFHAFSAAIRKIMDTTNTVESLNRVRRKTLKTRGSFPTGDAAAKRVFLAIRNFEKGGRAAREWVAARNQLAIMFIGRSDA